MFFILLLTSTYSWSAPICVLEGKFEYTCDLVRTSMTFGPDAVDQKVIFT
jgi:hypothetical protein